jgi:hypothetical protein
LNPSFSDFAKLLSRHVPSNHAFFFVCLIALSAAIVVPAVLHCLPATLAWRHRLAVQLALRSAFFAVFLPMAFRPMFSVLLFALRRTDFSRAFMYGFRRERFSAPHTNACD